MRATHLLSGMCMAVLAHAQILRVDPAATDPLRLAFEPAFISRNSVRKVWTETSIKREGEPMRPRNEQQQYLFDAGGRLAKSITGHGAPGSGRDTSWVEVRFDADGRPLEELRNDLHGWFALRDSLDPDGRVVRRTHVRIANAGTDRYAPITGLETVISDERCKHQVINDTAVRETWHNEHGLPYRERTCSRDRWGYLRAIEDHNLITGRRGRITLRYDEKGRLAERTDRPDLNASARNLYTWRYDAAGNITVLDMHQDERHTRHSEYLYEEGTMLLKAIITKDHSTGLIHVVRYHTERAWDQGR